MMGLGRCLFTGQIVIATFAHAQFNIQDRNYGGQAEARKDETERIAVRNSFTTHSPLHWKITRMV